MGSKERAPQLHWSHSARGIAYELTGRNCPTEKLHQPTHSRRKPISNALEWPSLQSLFEDRLQLRGADGVAHAQ